MAEHGEQNLPGTFELGLDMDYGRKDGNHSADCSVAAGKPLQLVEADCKKHVCLASEDLAVQGFHRLNDNIAHEIFVWAPWAVALLWQEP